MATINLHFRASGCDKKDFFGKSDPFYKIWTLCEDSHTHHHLVFTSEIIKKTLDPTWVPSTIDIESLCGGDFDAPIEIEVFDWDSDGSHDLIGRCTTTFSELTLRDRSRNAAHWERLLINPKKIPGGKKAKKGYVHSGIIHLMDFTVNQAPPGSSSSGSSGGGGGGGGAAASGAVAAAAGGDAAVAPAFVGTPQLGAEKVLQMTDGADLEIGMSWDLFPGSPAVDLDASALCLDSMGTLVDAVYFNQLSGCGGAINHSGDNRDGAGEGYDEIIYIDADILPPAIHYVVIVVNAHNGGTLASVETAKCDVINAGGAGRAEGGGKTATHTKKFTNINGVMTPNPDYDAAAAGAVEKKESFSLGCGGGNTGCVLLVLKRETQRYPPQWAMQEAGLFCNGTNFQESMVAVDAVMGLLVDPVLKAEVSLDMHKTFNMVKGDHACIPADLFKGGDDFFVGLGWECPGSIDLDASIVCGTTVSGGDHKGTVYYSNKSLFNNAIVHEGDNRTGDGAGDDEVIRLDLDNIPSEVKSLHVTVNCYTGTFSDVRDAYVRLVAIKTGHELARFVLSNDHVKAGVVFAKISRIEAQPGAWRLLAVGSQCGGRTATSSETKAACSINTN